MHPPAAWARPRRGPDAFAWPLERCALSSPFGYRQDPLRRSRVRFHRGVDLSAPYGALVRAVAAGRVVHAGWAGGHGREVCLEHRDGVRACYAHLAQILAEPGTWVPARGLVGRVGNSGRSTGPHLHLELSYGGTYVDPMGVLGGG